MNSFRPLSRTTQWIVIATLTIIGCIGIVPWTLTHDGRQALHSAIPDASIGLSAERKKPAQTKEPEFEGRKLSEWVKQLKSADVIERQEAVLALGKMGPPAVPALAEALKDELVNVRLWAAWGLRRIGPKAKPAVPALKAALKDEIGIVRVEAARALWAISERETAVRALIALLKHKDPSTRCSAADAHVGDPLVAAG